MRLSPADGERHTLIASHTPGNAYYVCMIAKAQMEELAASEGVAGPVEWRHMLYPDDPILRRCMKRLSATTPVDERGSDGRKDEAARRLMLRLLEANGGGTPSWRRDASIFDSWTVDDLVVYIDEHLKLGTSLVDIAPLVGLTPSHFARKFRRSTGLSLHRLVNVRRIQASFPLLRGNQTPLAHVAIDLGFASQSHFTRLFSELTGVSPAKYRKQFGRSVGSRASASTPFPPPTSSSVG